MPTNTDTRDRLAKRKPERVVKNFLRAGIPLAKVDDLRA